MNIVKLRLELQLEAGDLVQPAHALADALDSLALTWAESEGGDLTHAVVDVPRGQAAYVVEVKYGK
jgi:hypothetical protein